MKNSFLFLVLTIVALKLIDRCASASTKVITDHTCHPSGFLQMKASTNTIHCSSKNISNCCKAHKMYPKFHCSPPITSHTEAIMTIGSFTTPNRAIRPVSYNSNTKNNGGEMSTNGVRYNAVTSITDANTNYIRDSKGDMSLDGSRGNFVTSVDSRSNNNTSGEQITIDGVRQNAIANVDSSFVDGNRCNVVSTVDSRSNSNETEGENINDHLDSGIRHNAITSIDSGIGSVDGTRYNKGRMSRCGNNRQLNDNEMLVKLSTGWYNGGRRFLKMVRINWKGKMVIAKVVGECDSINGCDSTSGYRVPCKSNVVIASPAVWKALGVPKTMYPKLKITWSDA